MDFEKGTVLAWVGQVFLRRGVQGEWEEKPSLPDLPCLGRALADSGVFIWTEKIRQEVMALGAAAKYSFEDYVNEQYGAEARLGVEGTGNGGVGDGVRGVTGGDAGAEVVGGSGHREAQRAQAMALLDPMAPSVADILQQLAAEGGGVFDEQRELSTKSSREGG